MYHRPALRHIALTYLFIPWSSGGLLPELEPPVQIPLGVPYGGQHTPPRAVTQLPA